MKKHLLFLTIFCSLCAFTAKAQTVGPKVIVDNSKVTVTQYYSMPGADVCGKGKHSHPAHLTVLLTDATVTITAANGKTTTQKAPTGTSFWSEAETHEVVNSGKMPIKALIVVPKTSGK